MCIGESLVFRLYGAYDQPGTKRENCVVEWDGPVEPTVEWQITKPDGSYILGKGRVASIVADQVGTYWCTFDVSIPESPDRECPPDPVTVGPAIGWTPENFGVVEVRYKTFIYCPVIEGPVNPFNAADYFEGDDRGFQYDDGTKTSRTFQEGQVTVDPRVTDGQVGTPTMYFANSEGYADDKVADLGPSAAPCRYRISPANAVPVCDLPGVGALTFPSTRVSLTPAFEVKLHIGLSADNACIASCNISASIDIWFRQRCEDGILYPLEYRASGQHDGFPWHEIYLNGQVMYLFDVFRWNQGVFSLCGLGSGEWPLNYAYPGLDSWAPVPLP